MGSSSHRVAWVFAVLLAAVLGAGLGRAEAQATGEDLEGARAADGVEEAGDAPSPPPVAPSARRPVPDYDRRPDAPMTFDEALLWVPRVVFFPLHLFFEYAVRRPILALIELGEREHWPLRVVEFFTWNERQAGIVPIALYDFGLIPSGGFYLFWNDFGFDGNRIRLHAASGGTDLVRVKLSDTIAFDRHTELRFSGLAQRRPDHVYQGFGYNTYVVDRARYMWTRFEGMAQLSVRPWRASELRAEMYISENTFDARGYGFGSNDPSLETTVSEGRFSLPAGFDGFLAYRQRFSLLVDSREREPAPQHGVRLAAHGELGFDARRIAERRWVRYGGVAEGFVDLWEHRVLSLRVEAELADPLGSEDVPFTELPALGGTSVSALGGFLERQLIGRSLIVTTIEYHYPIWVYLDAGFHLSVGNVFAERFEDFELQRMRINFGFSIRSVGDPDNRFHIGIAFGTAPIIAGASIDAVRLVIGTEPSDH